MSGTDVHPILASARLRVLYLAFWALIGLLLAVGWSVTNPRTGFPMALAVVVPPSLVYGFVCLSAWYVCRVTPLAARSAARVLATHAGSAVVAAAVWMLAWEGWVRMLVRSAPFGEVALQDYRAQLPVLLAAGMLLFWVSSLLHYLLIAFEASRRAEARELGLEAMAREAELKALRAQIDPHFLFNSLHSISALTSTDAPGARRMCLLLADFFRDSVRLGAQDRILLEKEMQMVRAYLDIEKVRFGARLSAEVKLEPECGSCLVPPLILQPLAENAVRHGINSLVEGGVVRVTARCDAGTVRLVVWNPVDADIATHAGAGVGLKNVRRRLAARFGEEAETRWQREDGAFRVDIRFPCAGQTQERQGNVGRRLGQELERE